MGSGIRAHTLLACLMVLVAASPGQVGSEKAIPIHLADGSEFTTNPKQVVAHGRALFVANWTKQDGQGRPLRKGNGNPLSDPSDPLTGFRGFNRVSAPDANSCAGCHNAPFSGGGGDIVANVFVLGQRFDFLTFGPNADGFTTKGTTDEMSRLATIDEAANSRGTVGMFGSGYVEMLARQITFDLQAIRSGIAAGSNAALTSKGISFGTLARGGDGSWDTSGVVGIPAESLASAGPTSPPSLIIRPFHQAAAVISLRQFTNNALNHHHGIQSPERFGLGDTDGDGIPGPNDVLPNEVTTADVTALSVYQATLAVPCRVIPRDGATRNAIALGEQLFCSQTLGCASCHKPNVTLAGDQGTAGQGKGWVFTEPNPFNPTGNLQPGDTYTTAHGTYAVDLSNTDLPWPRLLPQNNAIRVPVFSDFKLHDVMTGDPDQRPEQLDMHQAPGSTGFFAGNKAFITRRLWGCASEPPYFHDGKLTTLREAIEHHFGEATASRAAFLALSAAEQAGVIEFLKSLRVTSADMRAAATKRTKAGRLAYATAIDDQGNPIDWNGACSQFP